MATVAGTGSAILNSVLLEAFLATFREVHEPGAAGIGQNAFPPTQSTEIGRMITGMGDGPPSALSQGALLEPFLLEIQWIVNYSSLLGGG